MHFSTAMAIAGKFAGAIVLALDTTRSPPLTCLHEKAPVAPASLPAEKSDTARTSQIKLSVIAPTRPPLEALVGQKIRVVAVFSRLGVKRSGRQRSHTVLL